VQVGGKGYYVDEIFEQTRKMKKKKKRKKEKKRKRKRKRKEIAKRENWGEGSEENTDMRRRPPGLIRQRKTKCVV